MAEFPIMPFLFDRYWVKTHHLTIEQHGAYFLLLNFMWHAPQRRIPNDDGWIANRFHTTVDVVRSLVRPIIEEFCQSDGNFITQGELIRQYNFVKQKHNRRSAAAKLRWEKEKSSYNADAPTPTPTPTQERKKEKMTQPPLAAPATPVDEPPKAKLFREGLTILISRGISEKQGRALIGKWLQTNPDAVGILAALKYAYENSAIDPVPYVTTIIQNQGGQGNGRLHGRRVQTASERAYEMADELERRQAEFIRSAQSGGGG